MLTTAHVRDGLRRLWLAFLMALALTGVVAIVAGLVAVAERVYQALPGAG